MLAMGRLAKAAVVIGAMVAFAGCSSDDKDPAPDKTLLDVNEMRGALLQAADIGPTWTAPAESTDPNRLVSVCGGTTTAPPVPPGATVVAAPLVDEGDAGAQTLNQTALVYDDPSGSQAGLAALRAQAVRAGSPGLGRHGGDGPGHPQRAARRRVRHLPPRQCQRRFPVQLRLAEAGRDRCQPGGIDSPGGVV
jgi:hypothetical protein